MNLHWFSGRSRALAWLLLRLSTGLLFGGTAEEQLAGLITNKPVSLAAVREVLAQGADVNAERGGQPLICLAARSGQALVVQELLNHGADANATSKTIPALSYAAATGNPATLSVLLAAGADPRAKDGSGRTALHWAAERAVPESVQQLLLSGAEPSVRNAEGKTAAEVARAGKNPEIATLIEQFHPAALTGGETVPAHADLSKLAAAAANNAVLRLARGEYRGPIEVRGKALTLAGAPDGSTVLTGGEQQWIVSALEQGRLTLRDVTVRNGGKATVGLFVKDAAATVANCRFENCPEYACYAEAGELTITGCTFTNMPKSAVVGLNGAALTVRRSTFTECKEAGVVAQEGKSLEVVDNRFDQVRQAVSCRGGSATGAIRWNQMTNSRDRQAESLAIAVNAGGPVAVAQNRIVRFAQGVAARGERVNIVGNVIMATPLAVYSEARNASVAHNAIYSADNCGILLERAPDAIVQHNVVVSGKSLGILARNGASARLYRNVVYASAAALGFQSAAATNSTLRTERYVGAIEAEGAGPALDAFTSSFAACARMGDSARRLQAAASNLVAAAESLVPAQMSPLAQALEAFAKEIHTAEAAAETLGRVSLHITDMAGQRGTPVFEVRDAGRPVAGTNAPAPLSQNSAADPWAQVPPGAYWLAPTAYPQWIQRVTVSSNQTLDAEIVADRGLWVSIPPAGDKPAQRLLLTLKTPEKLQRAIGRFRLTSWYRGNTAMLRPNVPKAQLAGALALARTELAKVTGPPVFPSGASDAEKQRLRELHFRTEQAAARILMAAGEAADAARLTGNLANVAYLESRLGRLEQGELVAALHGADTNRALAAAVQLHLAGLSLGDGLLRRTIAEHPENASTAAMALLDDDHPQTLAAMRTMLRSLVQSNGRRNWAILPPSLYLLAYGDKADWQQIGSVELSEAASFYLMYAVDDPRPLADMRAEATASLAQLSAVLRDFAPAREEQYAAYFQNAVWFTRAKPGMISADLEPAYTKLNNYLAYASFCRPSSKVAKYYCEGNASLGDAPWFPALHRKGELYDNLIKGTLGPGWSDHFDAVPHEQLVRDLDALQARDKMPDLDLLLARHLVTSRVYYSERDDYHDGTERRPFVIRSTNPVSVDLGGCAISGVLEVRPQLVEQELRLALRFRLEDYREGVPFMGSEHWKSDQPMRDGGRSLLDKLQVWRGEQNFPLTAKGRDRNGAFLYTAPLDQADLTGLLLAVDVRMTNEAAAQLIFDLFAGDCARAQRQSRERLARQEQVLRAEPKNRAALLAAAGALQALGRLNDAWQKYQQALALQSNDPDAWLAASDMFAGAGRHDRAAAVLRQMLQKFGNDADAWSNYALESYLAAAYPDAAAAAAKAAALAPGDGDAKVMAALCALLAGDARAAGQFAGAVPPGVQPERAALLWQASAHSAASTAAIQKLRDSAAKPTQELLDVLLGQSGLPAKMGDAARQCRLLCCAGYQRLVAGKPDEAKKFFAEALQTEQADQPEFRLAQAALEKLHP